MGADFVAHSFWLNNTTVKFEIWDTAGPEWWGTKLKMRASGKFWHDPRNDKDLHHYYRGAHAAIVMYDITERAEQGENNTLILEKYLPQNNFKMNSNIPSGSFEQAKVFVKLLQQQVKGHKLQE